MMTPVFSEVDILTVAYLEHAYIGHYIDFSEKAEYLKAHDSEISRISDAAGAHGVSAQTAKVMGRLIREFKRIGLVRDTLFWFFRKHSLTIAEQEQLDKDAESSPLKLGNWSAISSRLIATATCTPSRSDRLMTVGQKLSELVEARITPELQGMQSDYGENERVQALVAACKEAAVDSEVVLEIARSADLEDSIGLLQRIGEVLDLHSQPSPQNDAGAHDVFLSYAAADHDLAKRIQQALSQAGLSCFMAGKQLAGGDPWADVIRNALQKAREICLLYSPHAAQSEWILTEWGAAWVLEKRIVPILHRVDIPSLPERLRNLQAIDLADLDRYVKEIKARTK